MNREAINVSKREYLCLLLASSILIDQGEELLSEKYDLDLKELVLFKMQLDTELNNGKKEKNVFMIGDGKKESLPKRIAKAIISDFLENGNESMIEGSYLNYMKDNNIDEDPEKEDLIHEVLSALGHILVNN